MSNSQRSITVADRRKQVATYFRDDPNLTMAEVSKLLNVSQSTVANDVKLIVAELKTETHEIHIIRLAALVEELKKVRAACWEGLDNSKAGSGSRWMEEVMRAVDIENKMFGFYAPKRYEIRETTDVSKEQRDAAVAAAMRGEELQKQIEQNIKDADDIVDGEIVEDPL